MQFWKPKNGVFASSLQSIWSLRTDQLHEGYCIQLNLKPIDFRFGATGEVVAEYNLEVFSWRKTWKSPLNHKSKSPW
jgi:hypothetical protein